MQEQSSFHQKQKEKALILLKNSDQAGLSLFYAFYYRHMFWHGMNLLKDAFTIESIVQEAFLQLWLYRERLESTTHVYYFLRRVVKHECFTYFRTLKYRFNQNINHLEDYDSYQEYMYGFDPEEHEDEAKDELNVFMQLEQAISCLSSSQRRLISLCMEYEFRYKAISTLLGLSLTSVVHEVKNITNKLQEIINKGRDLEKVEKTESQWDLQILSTEQSEILRLRYEQGYNFDKIATKMRLPQVHVRKQFVIAHKLRKKLVNK